MMNSTTAAATNTKESPRSILERYQRLNGNGNGNGNEIDKVSYIEYVLSLPRLCVYVAVAVGSP